jgi:hypothetical protein
MENRGDIAQGTTLIRYIVTSYFLGEPHYMNKTGIDRAASWSSWDIILQSYRNCE